MGTSIATDTTSTAPDNVYLRNNLYFEEMDFELSASKMDFSEVPTLCHFELLRIGPPKKGISFKCELNHDHLGPHRLELNTNGGLSLVIEYDETEDNLLFNPNS